MVRAKQIYGKMRSSFKNSSFIANQQLLLGYLVLYLVQQHLHTTLH